MKSNDEHAGGESELLATALKYAEGLEAHVEGRDARIEGLEQSLGIILFALATEHPSVVDGAKRMLDQAASQARASGRHPFEARIFERQSEGLQRRQEAVSGRLPKKPERP